MNSTDHQISVEPFSISDPSPLGKQIITSYFCFSFFPTYFCLCADSHKKTNEFFKNDIPLQREGRLFSLISHLSSNLLPIRKLQTKYVIVHSSWDLPQTPLVKMVGVTKVVKSVNGILGASQLPANRQDLVLLERGVNMQLHVQTATIDTYFFRRQNLELNLTL